MCIGVPADKFRTICSSIDKLDKSPWSEVSVEVKEKGLKNKARSASSDAHTCRQTIEFLGKCVNIRGAPSDILDKLQKDQPLMQHKAGKAAISDMALCIQYLKASVL